MGGGPPVRPPPAVGGESELRSLQTHVPSRSPPEVTEPSRSASVGVTSANRPQRHIAPSFGTRTPSQDQSFKVASPRRTVSAVPKRADTRPTVPVDRPSSPVATPKAPVAPVARAPGMRPITNPRPKSATRPKSTVSRPGAQGMRPKTAIFRPGVPGVRPSAPPKRGPPAVPKTYHSIGDAQPQTYHGQISKPKRTNPKLSRANMGMAKASGKKVMLAFQPGSVKLRKVNTGPTVLQPRQAAAKKNWRWSLPPNELNRRSAAPKTSGGPPKVRPPSIPGARKINVRNSVSASNRPPKFGKRPPPF
mmetsp:Transcript_418/g.485  ORF Transcript_418/g.485 Transcript_418/m.485 type:complete len:305 (-) Transcript_418:55-969(-)